MIDRVLDAIEAQMYYTDCGQINRAHVACAYHLFVLASWMDARIGHEHERDAVQVMAWCALREADNQVVERILGIVTTQEDI